MNENGITNTQYAVFHVPFLSFLFKSRILRHLYPFLSQTNGPSSLEDDASVPSPKPEILAENTSNGISNLNVPSPVIPTDTNLTDSPKRMVEATAVDAASVVTSLPPSSVSSFSCCFVCSFLLC